MIVQYTREGGGINKSLSLISINMLDPGPTIYTLFPESHLDYIQEHITYRNTPLAS